MSFPATYSGWGHLGQGTMTRTASRQAQIPAIPGYVPVAQMRSPTVTKPAMQPAGLIAAEDPTAVPEFYLLQEPRYLISWRMPAGKHLAATVCGRLLAR